jgi:hypothetical protein
MTDPSILSNLFWEVFKLNILKYLMDAIIIKVDNKNMVITLAELPYKQYLRTKYWLELRKVVYSIVGHKCEVCGKDSELDIHHFNYSCRGKETLNDVICLCRNCHFAIHKNDSFISSISSRISLQKTIESADNIKKKFNNMKYIKYLPLTKRYYWTAQQISELWNENYLDVVKILKKDCKIKLITNLSIGKDEIARYFLNQFIWYLLEFDFPKISKSK